MCVIVTPLCVTVVWVFKSHSYFVVLVSQVIFWPMCHLHVEILGVLMCVIVMPLCITTVWIFSGHGYFVVLIGQAIAWLMCYLQVEIVELLVCVFVTPLCVTMVWVFSGLGYLFRSICFHRLGYCLSYEDYNVHKDGIEDSYQTLLSRR